MHNELSIFQICAPTFNSLHINNFYTIKIERDSTVVGC